MPIEQFLIYAFCFVGGILTEKAAAYVRRNEND
jgi:hypothetical protein